MLTRGKAILFYPAYDGPPLGRPSVCLRWLPRYARPILTS